MSADDAAPPEPSAFRSGMGEMPEEARTPLAPRVAGASFVFLTFAAMCVGLAAWRPFGAAPLTDAPNINILLFLLGTIGLTEIVVHSSATYPFRELAGRIPLLGKGLYTEDAAGNPDWGLLTCAMCTGMWIGAIMAGLALGISPLGDGLWFGARNLVLHGLVGSATAWTTHSVLRRLGAYS